MISVLFFAHPARAANLDTILSAYQRYNIVDEIVIVYLGDTVDERYRKYSKAKYISADLGLLSRYIYILGCKNRWVFLQDDDMLYSEHLLKIMLDHSEPLIGCHPRWFYGDQLVGSSPRTNAKTAPILLTAGVLIDSNLIPDVIKYARQFWPTIQQDYIADGIFLSRAIGKITGKGEFIFIKSEDCVELSRHKFSLNKNIDKHILTRRVYDFFRRANYGTLL